MREVVGSAGRDQTFAKRHRFDAQAFHTGAAAIKSFRRPWTLSPENCAARAWSI
jgi:hypothetical protein